MLLSLAVFLGFARAFPKPKDVCQTEDSNGKLLKVVGLSMNDDACNLSACLDKKKSIGIIKSGCRAILREWNNLKKLEFFDRVVAKIKKHCLVKDMLVKDLHIADKSNISGPEKFCVNGEIILTNVIWIATSELVDFKEGKFVG